MTPAEPDAFDGPQELAALFIQAAAEGLTPDLETWAHRLDTEATQADFRRMVADAQLVGSLLPRQVGSGIILGGRYRIEREIGAGGMGKVFEATDLQLDRAVAVKVLAAMGRSSFDPLELFRKESRLLASLRHPNIVAIHEAATDGDISYLVMELVNGRSLADVIDSVRDAAVPDSDGRRCAPQDGLAFSRALDNPTPEGRTSLVDARSWWRTVAHIMTDLVSTLEATHAKGVIHRDLKPSNILLRGDGTPVVLDFGLAGSIESGDSGDVTKGFVGSAAYLAPEQVRRRAVGIDTRTDIYQLGLVLFELLTLERAFLDEGIDDLLDRITKGRFARPRSLDQAIPTELEAICLQAMELDPSRRYATAKELREDLERYMGGQELPLAARGGTLADLARRGRYFARRHRARVLATAAVVLIAATGVLTPYMFPQDKYQFTTAEDLFEPIRIHGPELKTSRVIPGGATYEDDILGVVVQNKAPVYLYVMSIFGNQDNPQVAPMEPQIVEEQALRDGDMVQRWGLRVEPTDSGTPVAITQIGAATDDVPYEGLWVIASADPQPHVARWMAAMDAEGREGGVSYTRARELYEDEDPGPRTRGGKVKLSAEELAKILNHADSKVIFGEEKWSFERAEYLKVFFRVEGAPEQPLVADESDG